MGKRAGEKHKNLQMKNNMPLLMKKFERLIIPFQEQIESRQYLEAEKTAYQLLAIVPKHRDVLANLACIYIELGNAEQARKTCNDLIKLYPDYGYGLYIMGRVLFLENEWQRAIDMVGLALRSNNVLNDDVKSKCYNLLGVVYGRLGEAEKSLQSYFTAIKYGEGIASKAIDYSNYLFNLHYLPNITQEELYKAHEGYNELFNDIKQYEHEPEMRVGKLRIGYISPDLRHHVVAFFSFEFFRCYNHDLFEVVCYANCDEDPVSNEIAKYVDCWKNIKGMATVDIAQMIYEDRINILFDLAGHTQNGCLPVLAYKPAPIQISGIGWFDTTGLRNIDYFLADHYIDPDGQNDLYFTEKLLRLKHSHFCYSADLIPDEVRPQCMPAAFIKNGYITFGSFNNFAKVTDEMLILWKEILEKVTSSRLLFKNKIFGTPEGCAYIEKRLQAIGFPLNRVDMRGESTTTQYLNEYGDIDIMLDTFPYPGGGTTCDALYMGVPVISLMGKRHGSRFGYSLLKNIGLDDVCCAETEKKYIEKAVGLAKNTQALAALHQTLRAKMEASPLMDGYGYMQSIEQNYIFVWQQYLTEKLNEKSSRAWKQAFLATDAEAKNDYIKAVDLYNQASEILRETELNNAQEKTIWVDIQYRKAKLLHLLGQPEMAAKSFFVGIRKDLFPEQMRSLYSGYLKELLYLPFDDQYLLAENKKYITDDKIEDSQKENSNRNEEKIHIGYISSNFRQHPQLYFFHSLLNGYNRAEFKVICYARNREKDQFTQYLQGLVDGWKDISEGSWSQVAAVIAEDAVDILVDLDGHGFDSNLEIFLKTTGARRLAGFSNIISTGLEIEGFLSDNIIISIAEDIENYSEKKVFYQDRSRFCYTGRADIVPSLKVPALSNNRITFASFTEYAKLNDDLLKLWLEILNGKEKSVLLLRTRSFISKQVVLEARKRLLVLGYKEDQFLLLAAGNDDMPEYACVDIILDTYPYNSYESLCDALYMGVPVISLYSENNARSRIGYDILKSVGLLELAANSEQAYITKALALASDYELLGSLRQMLPQMLLASPLMDEKDYLMRVENVYRMIFRGERRNG